MTTVELPPKVITWRHTDPNLRGAISTALAIRRAPGDRTVDPRIAYQRNADGSPMSTAERVRILRSLTIATLVTVEDARWGGLPPLGEGDVSLKLGGEVSPGKYTNEFPKPGHLYAASTLARTLQLFGDRGRHTVWDASTTAGDPAVINQAGPSVTIGEGEAGFPPLLVGAVVLIAASAWTFAACYCGQAAAEVVDKKLTADALTARMLQTQASAIDLVTAHTQRERDERRAIPYSTQEQQVLDALLGTQRDIAKQTGTALPNPFAGAVKSMEKAADKAAFGVGAGAVAVGALALYLATRSDPTTAQAANAKGASGGT